MPSFAHTAWNYLRLRARANVGEFVSLSTAGICLVDLTLVLPYCSLGRHSSPFQSDLTIALLAASPLLLFALTLILQRLHPSR